MKWNEKIYTWILYLPTFELKKTCQSEKSKQVLLLVDQLLDHGLQGDTKVIGRNKVLLYIRSIQMLLRAHLYRVPHLLSLLGRNRGIR